MTANEIKLCARCFELVLGCCECDYCDATRFCPRHFFLRARQQGILNIEGGLFDGMGDVLDEDEFVRLVSEAVFGGTGTDVPQYVFCCPDFSK